MSKQKGLEVNDFLAKLGDRSSQCVILSGKEFDLRLEVGQPLLLALATLESGDTKSS